MDAATDEGRTLAIASVPIRRLRTKTARGDIYFREPSCCSHDQDPKRQRCHLRISSQLPGLGTKYAKPPYWWRQQEDSEYWEGHCPCCKRPLEFWLRKPHLRKDPSCDVIGKHAFVINLWGSKPDYVLGALVLGHSIRRTGSRHALVCLHTDDVSNDMLALLSRVWQCRQVEHVEWDKKSLAREWVLPHFSHVFTKLRAMALVEFEKVLVLDIDILVLSNVDELFDLMPPAASKRGAMLSQTQLRHGSALEGKWFFNGRSQGPWSWGQASGINAGVMLWQPNLEELDEMLGEITEPNHPEHCQGNGPEQDYLTRYWADAPWHHIGVEYNYQVHHALLPMKKQAGRAPTHVNLLDNTDKVKIVHYSATKPWGRVLDPRLRDLWPNRSRDADYIKVFLADYFGDMDWVESIFCEGITALDSTEPNRKEDFQTRSDADFPKDYVNGVFAMLERFLAAWFDAFQELQTELQLDLVQVLTASTGQKVSSSGDTAIGGCVRDRDMNDPALADAAIDKNGEREVIPTPFRWQGSKSCWTNEEAHDVAKSIVSSTSTVKLTVFCMAETSSSLLVFMEGGSEVCRFQDEIGIFVKLAGSEHKPIRFQADPSSVSSSAAINTWVAQVPRGAPLMFAALGVPTEVLSLALESLVSLGLPKMGQPMKPHTVLAAAGLAGIHESWSTHASEAAAYAALPIAE